MICPSVIALYSKGKSKGSAHAWVPSVDNITAVSNALVEVFTIDDYGKDLIHFRQFWPHTSIHAWRKYQLLPSTRLLYVVNSQSIWKEETIPPVLRLGGTEGTHCYQLKKRMSDLQKAVGELEKKHARKGVADVGDMEEE